MTLTSSDIRRVRFLLRAGFRHPQIARETGWSLWTIGRIASDPRFLRTMADDSDLEDGALLEDDAPPNYAADRLQRCGGCGATVYQWPCLTCQARAERDRFTAAVKRHVIRGIRNEPAPRVKNAG